MGSWEKPPLTNSSDRTPVPSGSGVHRRSILSAALATLPLGVLPTASPARAAGSSAGNGRKWTASWATAIQGAFVAPTAPQGPAVSAYIPQPDLSFALPNATTEGARDQTMRMIVKPDLWGETVRVRFSNLFGTRPVTFGAASVALQAYQANLAQGTSVPLTFGGRAGVTIEPGERRFSDPVRLPFVTERTLPLLAGRRLAVSFAVQGSSGPASFHLSALATNYISPPGSGDATGAEDDVAFPYTTTSFFFIDALDVTAPAGTLVVCALGDSITDGTFSTINGYDRWSDVMSRQLHNRFGERVSVVNEGIGGNAVVARLAGPPATERVEVDVLGLSGLDLVVWMEGINDLGGARLTPDPVIAGYRQVVGALHAAGVAVIGATVTPSLVPGGQVPANSPLAVDGAELAASYGSAQTDAYRRQLNEFILTSGIYDATVDFAAVMTDPGTGTLYAPFVPNSEGSAGDYLHPNRAGYQAMGVAAADAVQGLVTRRAAR